MPIAVTCQDCGQQFNLRDELAGRTVRCRCGRPITVPGTAVKDSLLELLDEELARPYEPPPEREAPKYVRQRRWRRRGARARKPRPVVSEPTQTQVLLWTAGGLTGWLMSLAVIPTAMYACLRAALQGLPADAGAAGLILVAMLVFNRGAFGLLLRAPGYVGWARWGGVLAAVSFLGAGIVAQAVAAQSLPTATGGLGLTNLFGNLGMAAMFGLVPALVTVAASIGPTVKPTSP
jgi:hypothetical protein